MNNLNDILKDRVIKEVHVEENAILIHLKPKEKSLPKSWEEFCEMFPIKEGECYIENYCDIIAARVGKRWRLKDRNVLPDRATAETVLALIQLIQLRNAYNGEWVPDWRKSDAKFMISFDPDGTVVTFASACLSDILYFKSENLCNEFLQCFRPLIEKLKPLYGIKEGGEK